MEQPLQQATDAVRITVEGRVARVRLCRAAERNTLTWEAMGQLRDAAIKLGRMPELAAVILHSEGPFSAGMDRSALARLTGSAAPPGRKELRETIKLGPEMCKAWEEIEAFTIAAIEDYCIGGAAALVAALDHRILGRSAFLRLPEVPLGMNMSWQSIPRIVTQIGPARAKQYVILGQRVDAATAVAWGLAEQVVDDGTALAAADVLAGQLLEIPGLSLRMNKQAINATANALHYATSFMDRDQFLFATGTDDFQEAIQAAGEKRPPKFTGS